MNIYTVIYYERTEPGGVSPMQNMDVEACCKLSAKARFDKLMLYVKIVDVRLKGDE